MGQQIIMHVHGGGIPAFVTRYPRWSCRVLRRASAVVTPSAFLADALAARGFDVRVIPNAIDLDRYPFRHRDQLRPRLLWMRTFHSVYNPEMAVRVVARLRKVMPVATMVMAGQDKGTEGDVRKLARSLGVDDAIRFVGFLDHEAKIQEASTADVFLNTNRVDNMPVTVVEACAVGLPVVATSVGGIPALLRDQETALLVPDDDDAAMAESVLKLLRDPMLARRLSAAGRRLAEQMSWENVGPQWAQLIGEVDVQARARAEVSVDPAELVSL
jgi:glycosyltransferase involved in cell wall biosynthesis